MFSYIFILLSLSLDHQADPFKTSSRKVPSFILDVVFFIGFVAFICGEPLADEAQEVDEQLMKMIYLTVHPSLITIKVLMCLRENDNPNKSTKQVTSNFSAVLCVIPTMICWAVFAFDFLFVVGDGNCGGDPYGCDCDPCDGCFNPLGALADRLERRADAAREAAEEHAGNVVHQAGGVQAENPVNPRAGNQADIVVPIPPAAVDAFQDGSGGGRAVAQADSAPAATTNERDPNVLFDALLEAFEASTTTNQIVQALKEINETVQKDKNMRSILYKRKLMPIAKKKMMEDKERWIAHCAPIYGKTLKAMSVKQGLFRAFSSKKSTEFDKV